MINATDPQPEFTYTYPFRLDIPHVTALAHVVDATLRHPLIEWDTRRGVVVGFEDPYDSTDVTEMVLLVRRLGVPDAALWRWPVTDVVDNLLAGAISINGAAPIK